MNEKKLLRPPSPNSFSAINNSTEVFPLIKIKTISRQRTRLITFSMISTITLITITGSSQFVHEIPAAVLNFYFWRPMATRASQDETNVTCHHSVFNRRVNSIHPSGISCSTTSMWNLLLGYLSTRRASNPVPAVKVKRIITLVCCCGVIHKSISCVQD